ncbi:hypothetical protein CC80DRAFT_506565 [Byssothecium circinans]|uniref:Uncharacterized protein n=1 Tax=Byssothecium circinans TaxID=147558 RepID=A0A6A5TN85_9PLEO|nr:hypothetical protein CC80DRAFT_506565 [Byssothecium circinans]
MKKESEVKPKPVVSWVMRKQLDGRSGPLKYPSHLVRRAVAVWRNGWAQSNVCQVQRRGHGSTVDHRSHAQAIRWYSFFMQPFPSHGLGVEGTESVQAGWMVQPGAERCLHVDDWAVTHRCLLRDGYSVPAVCSATPHSFQLPSASCRRSSCSVFAARWLWLHRTGQWDHSGITGIPGCDAYPWPVQGFSRQLLRDFRTLTDYFWGVRSSKCFEIRPVASRHSLFSSAG